MTETVSGASQAGDKPQVIKGKRLTIERLYTTAGVHPYDEVTWERRDVVQTNWKTGETVFEQRGVEFPDFWSRQRLHDRHHQVLPRRGRHRRSASGACASSSTGWCSPTPRRGKEYGYFATDADAEIFEHELTWMLLHQVFSFNSPVWFNVGTPSPAAGLAPASSSPSTTRWTRSSTGTGRRA